MAETTEKDGLVLWKMAVSLWASRISRMLTEEEIMALLERLPALRRERLLRIKNRERWCEPLCAYALLRLAVRRQYNWTVFPEIDFTEQGKPFFSAYPTVHFSISHTSGGVLVGLSDIPIGVDLERIKPVGQRVRRRLAAQGQTEDAYFRHWTLHEAAVKRNGSDSAALFAQDWIEGAQEISVFPGYTAAVAGKGSIEKPVLISLDELLSV